MNSDKHTVNAPVSFVSKTLVDQNDSIVIIEGNQSDDVIYGNGYVKGAFDMVNRYMAGDWRQFYFDIQDEMINSILQLNYHGNMKIQISLYL